MSNTDVHENSKKLMKYTVLWKQTRNYGKKWHHNLNGNSFQQNLKPSNFIHTESRKRGQKFVHILIRWVHYPRGNSPQYPPKSSEPVWRGWEIEKSLTLLEIEAHSLGTSLIQLTQLVNKGCRAALYFGLFCTGPYYTWTWIQ